MRNRAKCALCGDVIESVMENSPTERKKGDLIEIRCSDYVECKCGEIAVFDGPAMGCASKNGYRNFLRLKEDGTEIPVKYHEKEHNSQNDAMVDNTQEHDFQAQRSREELLQELIEIVSYNFKLPPHEYQAPLRVCDFVSVMVRVIEVLKKGP